MAGLVGYASSDEEDHEQSPPKAAEPQTKPSLTKDSDAKSKPGLTEASLQDEKPLLGPAPQPATAPGPSLPSAPEEDDVPPTIDTSQAPGSPYTANRSIIHDLTLPSVPNFDIPPSPPGSPPPGASRKFEQFLDLKKKGVHFNSKLENSNALRNPSLTDKLMSFVGIDERSQYETTLPAGLLWDASDFPDSAFRERLRRSQDKIAKEREAEKASGGRTAVEFVPSTTSGGGSAASSAGGISKREKRKGDWT